MTEENLIHDKAESIRDVIRYLRRFKNALVIIYIDDKLLDSPLFTNHIKDICRIHEAGLKVIVVPGANKRINEILEKSGIEWSFHKDYRITKPEAMPLIKMAAFDVSNQIMTSLAGEKTNAVIGNWVRARGKGIIDGFDYGTTGEIDKLQVDAIENILANGFVPIFPCIGWSLAGKPYNISSIQLAEQIAVHLKADKLFYLIPGASISAESFKVPEGIGTSPEGNIPAMNLEEVDEFLKANKISTNKQSVNSNSETAEHSVVSSVSENVSREKIFLLLQLAKEACNSGVTRVHILNGSLDGTIPCEIFSDLGSGTMIYYNNYGGIRAMTRDDIPGVLNVMKPFISAGILLPRTRAGLLEEFQHYIVYELDGAIRACASLIPYDDGQMEIAGVAVNKTFSHVGIGPKLVKYLVKQAVKLNAKSVFLLTTQTADWFENLGFYADDISTLPEARKAKWTSSRGSKVLRYDLNSVSRETE